MSEPSLADEFQKYIWENVVVKRLADGGAPLESLRDHILAALRVADQIAEKDKQLLDMSAYTAEFNVYREQLAQMTKELAEKDAEIASLRARVQELEADNCVCWRDENPLAESRTVTDAQRKLDAIAALHRLSPVPNGKGVTGEWCICGHVRCKERAILEEQPAAESAS